jgi:hypothetical protein
MVSLVKTGKTSALWSVSKSKSVLVLLGALGLAGCASVAPKSAASGATRAAGAAPSRIVLEPSSDAYRSAVQSLTPAEQKILKKGMAFTVDNLIVAPTPIVSMAWSHRRADTPSTVNISDFVRFLDVQPALAGGARVNLVTARVLAGVTYDQATFDPVFRIQAEIEPANASVTTVSALGAGPICSRPADEFPPASAKLTRSEEIAFMKAFLKTLLKINAQLSQG